MFISRASKSAEISFGPLGFRPEAFKAVAEYIYTASMNIDFSHFESLLKISQTRAPPSYLNCDS